MTVRRRRSDRSGRSKLHSPGRPDSARREELVRFWAAIATGRSSEDAARDAGVSPPVPALDLPVEPRLRQLRRHRRCGMPRLEQAHRQALENHVDWYAQMGTRRSNSMTVGIIAVVDGLKGFPEAITAAFPDTTVQTCIVHLVRHSLNFCSWKDRKMVAADLRRIYEAATADAAAGELNAFEEKWTGKYPSIAPAWRRAWDEVTPFFAFDPAIRKIIYTTTAIESLNRVIRKSIKTRGSFPTEEAATKLIYLAIRNFEKGGRNVREWFDARNQFAMLYAERFNT